MVKELSLKESDIGPGGTFIDTKIWYKAVLSKTMEYWWRDRCTQIESWRKPRRMHLGEIGIRLIVDVTPWAKIGRIIVRVMSVVISAAGGKDIYITWVEDKGRNGFTVWEENIGYMLMLGAIKS